MAFTEFETKRYQKILDEFCEEHGPPLDLREQLSWAYRIERQTVILFEVRPRFNDPGQKTESAIAKGMWVKSRKRWRIFWQRGNGAWVLYQPCPEVRSIVEFLKVVKMDTYGCFLG